MVVNKCEKNSSFNDKYFLRLLRVLTIMIITINNTGREGLGKKYCQTKQDIKKDAGEGYVIFDTRLTLSNLGNLFLVIC